MQDSFENSAGVLSALEPYVYQRCCCVPLHDCVMQEINTADLSLKVNGTAI